MSIIMPRTIILWGLLSLVPASGEQMFKCIQDNGTVSYQRTACADHEPMDVLDVETPPPRAARPIPELRTSSVIDDQGPGSEIDKAQPRQESAVRRCHVLRRKIQQEEKRLREECVRHRNTYCNESGEQILASNRAQEAYWVSRQNFNVRRNYERNIANLPPEPLEQYLQEREKLRCGWR